MSKRKKIVIAYIIAGSVLLLAVLAKIFVPKIQKMIERAEAERWILEYLDFQDNEFAPQELVDAVYAEYITEEAEAKGMDFNQWISYNCRKAEASEQLIA
jgi:superfamily I DNA/RNA helicase